MLQWLRMHLVRGAALVHKPESSLEHYGISMDEYELKVCNSIFMYRTISNIGAPKK